MRGDTLVDGEIETGTAFMNEPDYDRFDNPYWGDGEGK
jgi:hypothetical protein